MRVVSYEAAKVKIAVSINTGNQTETKLIDGTVVEHDGNKIHVCYTHPVTKKDEIRVMLRSI